jgi:hypothetical protein
MTSILNGNGTVRVDSLVVEATLSVTTEGTRASP